MLRLELIAAGSVDASEARSILGELPRELDSEGARKLFAALRAWTWKALDQKRRDPELREWHDLMKRAQVRAKSFDRVVAQLQVLLDLIHESLAVAMRRPVDDVLKRRHAKSALALLRDAPDAQLSKQSLMEHLSVKDANLSRLMNVLIGAGLVERLSHGREAHFRLSRMGQEHAAGLVAPVAIGVSRRDRDVYDRCRWSFLIQERSEQLQEQMLAVLTDKRAKKWFTSFDRIVVANIGDTARSVRKVGAAYYGTEHNLFGDPAEVARGIVFGRPEPDPYSAFAVPRLASACNG